MERATRKGGGGGTSCSSYISFLSFLIKGEEWQPEHILVLSLSNGYTSICPLLSDNLHQNNFIVEMRK